MVIAKVYCLVMQAQSLTSICNDPLVDELGLWTNKLSFWSLLAVPDKFVIVSSNPALGMSCNFHVLGDRVERYSYLL